MVHLPPPLRPRPRPIVAERVVALADRLPKAGRAGTGDEVEPLLRVARDAVEERAERAAGGEAHVLGGLVAERSEETRLNSSHLVISYAVFCLKKKIRRKYTTC